MEVGKSLRSGRTHVGPVLVVLVTIAVVAGGRLVALVGRKRTPTPLPSPGTAGEDPRVTFATGFRNVRPGVKYVGDQACGRCHQEHAESYGRHPMGRSLFPVSHSLSQDQ